MPAVSSFRGLDGRVLFGVAVALALALGLLFWSGRRGEDADSSPVPADAVAPGVAAPPGPAAGSAP